MNTSTYSRPALPLTAAGRRLAACLTTAALAALAACGGGGGAATDPVLPPPPPGVVNQPPVAAFGALASLPAGGVVSLDASASSDPEGSALSYSWDFGDGSRGGAAQIAHLYPQPGRYSVRLTVSDAQGATGVLMREVTVTPPAAAARQVQIAGLVKDLAGLPLAGVVVSVQGSSAAATSDAQGRVALTVGVGVEVVLRVSGSGHAEQTKVLMLPATVGSDGYFEVALMPRAAAQTLADAAAGGTLSDTHGARLTLPPAALVDANGGAVTGAVDVTMTPLDVNGTALSAFPGRFEGINPDGRRTPIVSYGSTEFTLSQGGRQLQLKAGARATLELPLYASQNLDASVLVAGGTLPLWSLDERSGQWVNEGNGTLIGAAASPTGLALRAEVGHLSWWNADLGYTPYRPRPRCINDVPGQYDSIFEQATICKMLAEMDKPIPAAAAATVRPLGVKVAAAAAAAAAASAPRFPFPAVRIERELPIGGGVALDVPPDFDVLLSGTALNGTWRGQTRVRGAQGAFADVNVALRPVEQGGSSELITLPFDQVRAAAPLRTDRYRFQASAGQGVEVTVAQATGSTLTGTLRLRDPGGALLASVQFADAAALAQFKLVQAGEHSIDLEPATNAPGGYRLQAVFKEVSARVPSSALTAPGAPGNPKLAANAGGDAVAAWTELRNGNLELRASHYLAASAVWAAARTVVTVVGFNDAVDLQLGLDDAGNATLAWQQGSGPVVARYTAAGQSWGAALPLASAACAGRLAQRLALSSQGDATLLWQRDGAGAGLCARRFSAGQWGAERVIGSATPAAATMLALATTPGGNAVAAWALDASAGLASARFDARTDTWSPAIALTSGTALITSIALASDGAALVAWAAPGAAYAAHWPAADATWRAARRVGDNSSGAVPRAVWRGGSLFHVAWQSARQGVRSTGYDAATGLWGTELGLGPSGRLPLLVELGADAGGRMLAVWIANKPLGALGFDLGFSRFVPGAGAWVDSAAMLGAQPVVVSANSQPAPQTVGMALAAGNALLLWREFQLAPAFSVMASRISATP